MSAPGGRAPGQRSARSAGCAVRERATSAREHRVRVGPGACRAESVFRKRERLECERAPGACRAGCVSQERATRACRAERRVRVARESDFRAGERGCRERGVEGRPIMLTIVMKTLLIDNDDNNNNENNTNENNNTNNKL